MERSDNATLTCQINIPALQRSGRHQLCGTALNRLTLVQDGVTTTYAYDTADRLPTSVTSASPLISPGQQWQPNSPRAARPSPGIMLTGFVSLTNGATTAN